MAFNFKEIYDYKSWLVNYENAQGFQLKYLEYCEKFAKKTEFPNLAVGQIEMVTGGVFRKESTPAVVVTFKKTTLKGLGIFFRPQRFGNLVNYSLLKTVDRGLWGSIRGKHGEDMILKMIDKMKNLAQVDELLSLDGLGDLIFTRALLELDPDFKEMKPLMSKNSTSGDRFSGN